MTRRATRDWTYDAKGDIFVATGDNIAVRIPMGTDGYVLTADSSETSGVAWKAGVEALDWQESVLDKDLVAAPAAVAGDRYIVGTPVAGGDPWFGHEDDIAEYDGAAWDFFTPDSGTATFVEDELAVYMWNGTAWVQMWAKEFITEITITGPTQMVKNRGYIANNAARVGLTLPTTSEVGDYVLVVCKGDGGFRIVQGAGQRIFFDDIYTTSGAGGYIDSTYENDTVKLICIQADTLWTVSYAVGELQVV